jgi:phosphatidylinositol alpha 1,6-mannosyltransferase
MRVALVTESYPPSVNGVAGSVLRLREQLEARGHGCLVVAPRAVPEPAVFDAQVVHVPAVGLPGYRDHRVPLPWPRLAETLEAYAPDVVHLASPTVLGAHAVTVSRRLGIPAVAVFQTDLARFAGHYGAGWASGAAWRWLRGIHARADLTLAPSRATVADLDRRGFPRVRLWPRGVDLDRFHPGRRDEPLRSRFAPDGEVLVGYVGRLAPEKRVDLLAALRDVPGVRLVVVGDGPQRRSLERLLPQAVFTGALSGDLLAATVASLDVLAHTGPAETFGQAVQEAFAAGVPVVAPAAGGPLDLVRDGLTGILYEACSAGALRAAVGLLVADPALRAVMGRHARASVAGRSWHAVTAQYLDHVTGIERRRGRELEAA